MHEIPRLRYQVWWLLTKALVTPAVNSYLVFVSCCVHGCIIQTVAMSDVPFEVWTIL